MKEVIKEIGVYKTEEEASKVNEHLNKINKNIHIEYKVKLKEDGQYTVQKLPNNGSPSRTL